MLLALICCSRPLLDSFYLNPYLFAALQLVVAMVHAACTPRVFDGSAKKMIEVSATTFIEQENARNYLCR